MGVWRWYLSTEARMIQIERAQALMEDLRLDAVVASSWENLTYLSGVYIYTQRAIPSRQSALVLTSEGNATYIFCSIEEAQIRDTTWIDDLRGYHEFTEDPIAMLVDLLQEERLTEGRVGLELQYLPAETVTKIETGTAGPAFSDATKFFQQLRAIKSPDEIALMERAATVTRQAHELAFSETRSGDTEKAIANRLLHHLFDRGADETAFITVATGTNTLRTHHLAEERRIQQGDIVRTDVGGRFSGYYSDLGRTYVVGEPTKSQSRSYRRLRTIQEEIIAQITVGQSVRKLYEACRANFAHNELDFHMPHIGHSMGLELHEWPIIHPGEDAVLAENMLVNVEPIYVDAKTNELFFVEDLVLVTSDGPRLLSGNLAPTEIPVIA